MLLTILIPTINRSESLQKVLVNLISQIHKDRLYKHICLAIVDSSTTDESKDIVQSLQRQYPQVKIRYLNDRLIKDKLLPSIDLSIAHGLALINGKYLWLASDNSGFKNGILSKVINLLTDQKPTYMRIPSSGSLAKTKKVFAYSPQAIAFLGTFLNSNVYLASKFKDIYLKLLPSLNGSWLIFYAVGLEMAFSEKNLKKITYLNWEGVSHSIYRAESYKQNSWSENWNIYIKVGYYFSLINERVQKKYQLPRSFFEKILNTKIDNLQVCFNYLRLRLKNKFPASEPKLGSQILKYPGYDFLTKKIIIQALNGQLIVVYFLYALVGLFLKLFSL